MTTLSAFPSVAYLVVTAAGAGTRLGWDRPKALVPVAGKTILEWALRGVSQWAAAPSSPIIRGVVTAPPDHIELFTRTVTGLHLDIPWLVVPGGESRQESVYAGMKALLAPRAFPVATPSLPAANSESAVVMIHDAARCFTPVEVFQTAWEAIRQGAPGVVPALPVVDTIRVASPSSTSNLDLEPAGETLDRNGLRAVQTPQAFRGDLIFKAHRQFATSASAASWDDALLLQNAGFGHYFIPGSELSAKITTPRDLQIANWWAETQLPNILKK